MKKKKKKISRNNMIYYSNKETSDFNAFKTIKSFGVNVYSGKITINEADQEQADLLEYILNFINIDTPKNKDDKKKQKKCF